MARETAPKDRVWKNAAGIPWTDPRFKPDSASDMAKLIRMREGCVGDDGIRRIKLSKTGNEFDDPRLERYEEMGYEIADKGYRYELSIPQSEWEKREAQRRATAAAANPKPKADSTFGVNSEEELAPINTRDILGQSAE